MQAIILLVVSFVFSVAYNVITMIVNLESADGNYQELAGVLWVINELKDWAILTLILFKIFKISC